MVQYHFLGNMECPSWLLEEICTTFANMTVLKFRELCNRASLIALTGHDKQILQTSEGDNVEDNHNKILLISSWLLMKPAGYDCSPEDLEKEVSHIGLPEEHSKELKNVYGKNMNELQEKLKQNIQREDTATVGPTSSTSFTMQSADQTYNVSLSSSMMSQFKNDVENSLASMRDLHGILQ